MSENIIDIENLLKPISVESPQGVDIRTDLALQDHYYDLKELRYNLRKVEDELLLGEDSSTNMPSWEPVIMAAQEYLTQYSKDIELAAWLVEALVREYGYQGLLEGFRFFIDLCKEYSGDLHPIDEDEGTEDLMAITLLSGTQHPGTVTAAINLSPIILNNESALSIWDIYGLKELRSEELLSNDTAKYIGNLTVDETEVINDTWQSALAIIREFEQLLTEKYNHNAPSLSQLLNTISQAMQLFKQVSNQFNISEGNNASEGEASNKLNLVSHNSREQAIKSIELALSYFSEQEPHSPLIYLLRRCLRWNKLNLQDIIADMVPHDEVRQALGNVLGMTFKTDIEMHHDHHDY